MSYIPKWLKELLTPENVRDFWDLVKQAFSKPAKILAVGSTGTGKTALVNALGKQLIPRMIEEVNRTQFAKEEKVKLKKTVITITDTPGHRIDPDDEDSARLNPQLSRAIGNGPYVGILNVVSYGYHQYDLSPRPKLSNRTLGTYLNEHRRRELVGLHAWVPSLATIGHDPFAITVVTKADLWYGTPNAMDFYDSGEYYDELCRIAGRKIEHHVLRMSSRRQKFYNQIDPKPGWDDDDRARARSNLIEQLIEAIAARGKK